MSKHFITLIFCLFSICGYINRGWCNNTNYYFKQIAIENGLSQSSINSILCDRKGMLWIGTKAGLNCFDQYELKNYFNDKENPRSLPGNFINFIAEDQEGHIWVSTNNGVALYNPENNSFDLLIKEKAFCYLNVPDQLLIGTTNAIYKYDQNSKQIGKVDFQPDHQSYYEIIKLLSLSDHTVLVATKNYGLFTYDLQTDKIEKLPYADYTAILDVYMGSDGYIYLSTYNQGLFCFSLNRKQIAHYTTQNSQLSNNIILCILEKEGNIWLGTDGGGINILNPKTQKISCIKHIPGDAGSLPVNSITTLYKDSENNLWAGSVRGGIFGIKETYIKTYKDVALNNTNGLSEKAIISLHEDEDSILWIGTDGGGINQYNPFTGQFKHYPSTYGDKVASITSLSSTELLVSLYSKEVFRFDKKTGEYRPFTIVDRETNLEECYSGYMALTHQISQNKIYILSQNARIYNPETKQFFQLKMDEKRINEGALNLVYADDSLAYLIKEHYVLEALQENDSIRIIFSVDPSETIHSLSYDPKGTFWIGSDQGLSYYNKKEKVLHRVETKLFNNITQLFLDNQGRLWICAQNMLFSYVINENRFVVWSESDGFSPNEILFMYQKPSKTNNIYLAGTNGLVKIDKNISYSDKLQPQIELTDIIFNGRSYMNQFDGKEKKIYIPWNYTSLSITINLNEKDVFRKALFRYSIAGLNSQYIESYNHKLELPGLNPGSYSILVSCNTKSGIWSQPVKIATLHITPPWYKSNWFIFSMILLFFSLLSVTVHLIIRKKENKLKWEMKEHEQTVNEEKIRFLVNISHELRTPLTLIYAPLKRLIDKSNDKLKPELIREQLNNIYKQTRQMKNIINMVLDLNRIKTGEEPLQKLPHLLNEWVRSVCEDFRNECEEKKIDLQYQLDDAIEYIWFDEWKCQIILSNLLMNALKFSDNQTEIIISTRLINNVVRISVKDQGIGLQNVDSNKLFSRFYQGEHNKSGSGIGLSYAKILIEMHGGNISTYNNTDRGATFYYELPVLTDTSLPEEIINKNNSENIPIPLDISSVDISCSNYSILIVEDRQELRSFLKDSFKDLFKHIYTAEDGVVALEITKSKQPDIIVSDVMMPRMDGYELCKNIKSNVEISHIPIILLTAKCDQDSTSTGYKLGADFYLSKPFELDFLLTIIANLLKGREAIKQKYKEKTATILPQDSTISNADETFMVKLNNLINNNLSNPDLDVKFLIANMAMSRASLYNKVKVLTDMGVNDYINQLRIEKASSLLIHSDLSISEISFEVGFTYQRYFSTIFKQIKGATPSQFKDENRKNNTVQQELR